MEPICLVGSGAWGTTIGNLLAKKGIDVYLWDNNPSVQSSIRSHHINDPYLPGIELSPRLIPEDSLEALARKAALLIIAVPSKYLSSLLSEIASFVSPTVHFLFLTKGLLMEEKPLLITDLCRRHVPEVPLSRLAVLSGPNFAVEIARDFPAATVVAGTNDEYVHSLQSILSTVNLRVYTNSDLIGVQLGGMMKNVIALSAGIIDGQGLGMNLKSALLVRGVAEMNRVFSALGVNSHTLYGLSGLGDLITTSMSDLSRNHWAGEQIGKGLSLREVQSFGRTVEGIDTLPALLKLAETIKVELPICQATYEIIFQGKPVREAINALMSRKGKAE